MSQPIENLNKTNVFPHDKNELVSMQTTNKVIKLDSTMKIKAYDTF